MYKLEPAKPVTKGEAKVNENGRSVVNTLLANEIQYKRQIKKLEAESRELLKTFDTISHENRVLRSQLEHGVDVLKMKRLVKENEKLTKTSEDQKNELESLRAKVIDLEKELNDEKTDLIDREWNEIVAEGKKAAVGREAELRATRRGKYDRKKKRMILDDIDAPDEVDLKIDTLEKQTIILLNKIQILSTEKYQVKFATSMDKGYLTKNPVLANAINMKLDLDIKNFEERLEYLTNKHKTLKVAQEGASKQPGAVKTNPSKKSPGAKGPSSLPRQESERIKSKQADTSDIRFSNFTGPDKDSNQNVRSRSHQLFNRSKPPKTLPPLRTKSETLPPLVKRKQNSPNITKHDSRIADGSSTNPKAQKDKNSVRGLKGEAPASWSTKATAEAAAREVVRRRPPRPQRPKQKEEQSQIYDNFYDETKVHRYSNSIDSFSPLPIRFRDI